MCGRVCARVRVLVFVCRSFTVFNVVLFFYILYNIVSATMDLCVV